ncbi:MAG: hypothetical protein QM756_33465 [Polyangiaceae bacterium]
MENLLKLLTQPKLLVVPALLGLVGFGYNKLRAHAGAVSAVVDAARERASEIGNEPSAPSGKFTLPELRRKLKTTALSEGDAEPPPAPPAGELELVHYQAPLGDNAAYVTPAKSATKRPAIVWIMGGMGFGLSETSWQKAPYDNDQSARLFREAGIVTMYPALRGANGNPGRHECFLGEVDDILAAAEFLAARPDVESDASLFGRAQHRRHHGAAGCGEQRAVSSRLCFWTDRRRARLRQRRLPSERRARSRVEGA